MGSVFVYKDRYSLFNITIRKYRSYSALFCKCAVFSIVRHT